MKTRKELFNTYLYMFAAVRAKQQVTFDGPPEALEETAAVALGAYDGAKDKEHPGDFTDFNKSLDEVLRGVPIEDNET